MKNVILSLIFSLAVGANFAQWTAIPVPLNFMYGSNFINDQTGFLLSGNGYVERTSDGGATWDSIGTPYSYSWLNTSYFINDTLGYIGGGANFPFPPASISDLILKTTDGGLSFDSLNGNFTGSDILAIDFADEDHGMFIGSFRHYKTSDGGQNIDTLFLPGNPNSTMFGADIEYVDLQHAYLLAIQYLSGSPISYKRFVFLSEDQGANWQQIYTDTANNPSGQLQFLNAQLGFLASNNQLLQTQDGGLNWESILTTPNLDIQQVEFVNSNTGFLTAQFGDTSYLYTTLDGGLNWQIELIDTDFQATNMSITENFIYASDYLSLFKRAIDSISTGIREQGQLFHLTVYPNPTAGVVHIDFEFESETSYQLVNAIGQIMEQGVLDKGSIVLHLANHTKGIYTLILSDAHKPIAFSRIVLQ